MKIAYFFKREAEYLPLFPDDASVVCVRASDDDRPYSAEQMRSITECDAIYPVGAYITEQVISACARLRLVQLPGAGYDKIDIDAASRRGVLCCNNGNLNANRVADFAMMMILNLFGGVVPATYAMSEGNWDCARRFARDALDVEDKTLGIIGFGSIGAKLALRATAFGMNVLYHDQFAASNSDVAARVAARLVALDELLHCSDAISIHTTFSDTTRNLISAAALAKMKPGAFLVCTARGGIVDETALHDALESGHLAGAAMDVFSKEPIAPDNPLLNARNIYLSPHMAGIGKENTRKAFLAAIENIRSVVVHGRLPTNILNPGVVAGRSESQYAR